MSRLANLARHNAIALTALFIALGGTSYAALRIPAASVGTRQLKNHSVSAVKLDPGSIAGYIRDWVRLDAQGHVIAARPKVKVVRWNPGPGGLTGGLLQWRGAGPRGCFASANAESAAPVVSADAIFESGRNPQALVTLSGDAPVDVTVVCPQP